MNKFNLHIMADSASEISPENAKKYGIDIIPMIVTEGNREYLDGIDFNADNLLVGLLEKKQYKTAQIPLNTYLQKFKKYAEEGSGLVCFVLSSGLTGSYDTALIAKNMVCENYPEADITVIDSRSASQGYGIVVLESAKYLEKHAENKEDFLNYVEFLKKHIVHLFTVEDIEYLYRGGRITKTEAILGGILNIKPILDVSSEGKLRSIGKARGTKNLIKALCEEAKKRLGQTDISTQTVCISSGLDTEIQENIKAFFEREYGVKNFIIQKIGPTVGAHTGPYMCAFYFFDAELKSYSPC